MRPRDNPFRVERLEALHFRPQGMDWATLEHRLMRLNLRAAIIGPEGSGKTTLLRELGDRLEGWGYCTRWIQVGRDRRPPPGSLRAAVRGLDERDVILFDGVGHLSPPRWWAVRWRSRRAGGLIVTGHRGRPLPVLIRTRTDPALLAALIRSLLWQAHEVGCGLAGMEVAEVEREAAALWHRHGGDVRAALRSLYDRCAGRSGR